MMILKLFKNNRFLWILLIVFFITCKPGQNKMIDKQTETNQISFTVVFDNVSYSADLKTEWGYSCLIQTDTDTLLFDTGSNGKVLLENMAKLQIDPHSIKTIVISHSHWDHLGGLANFLEVNSDVTLYIPNSFDKKIEKDIVQAGAKVIRVDSFCKITGGIYSLGELGGKIPEQSLAVHTVKGIAIITGCAHPGIVNIVKHTRFIFSEEPMYLLMGGFHLKNNSEEEMKRTVKTIHELDVKYVAPSHCTGEKAIDIFKQIFGHEYIKSGVGKVIEIN
jgi:7,8-dihydropterin-6-yl-methyl-4-(beta-D-ribofuranosyl)aminobenzene 5'-phosphate synthase